jgi:hypothetical protein
MHPTANVTVLLLDLTGVLGVKLMHDGGIIILIGNENWTETIWHNASVWDPGQEDGT